ncbi:MAG: lysophospholipid acyltransferase family protein [Pirellulaceae bacterium]
MSVPASQRAPLHRCLRYFARLAGILFFGLRCHGRHRLPKEGAVLVCANHQSYLDPIFVGLTLDRPINYVARQSLFEVRPIAWLINLLSSIPIHRDGMGLAGLKECLRRLKQGEMVLIFPEGTRSLDGNVTPLKPGFCMLARRGKVSLLPVGLDGAYDAWPRSAKLPRRARIHIVVGEAIPPDVVKELDDRTLVAELEQRIRECHAWARSGRQR